MRGATSRAKRRIPDIAAGGVLFWSLVKSTAEEFPIPAVSRPTS